jgi:murein DD-endopeptidase MepM/ murein hydrolase activator NlpD
LNSAKTTMRQPLYRYNPQTCRYERSQISWGTATFYSAGVFICSALMLTGMLLVHDYVVDSEKERLLKKENAAIKSTDVILTRQLDEIEITLNKLKEQDRALHNKFFASSSYSQSEKVTNNRRRILLSNAPQLRTFADELESRASDLMNASSISNSYYAGNIQLNFYRELFSSIPSIPPVSEVTTQNLVSGFGMRINPFHKGLYHHDGIDIAVPRGTEVGQSCDG